MVKNFPAMRETWVGNSLVLLGWKDPLEKKMTSHSSILPWRIPWIEESMGSERVRHEWVTNTFSLLTIRVTFHSPSFIHFKTCISSVTQILQILHIIRYLHIVIWPLTFHPRFITVDTFLKEITRLGWLIII